MIYYTSDIHFSDEKIRVVCKRPFANIAKMNEKIIQKWNGKIKDTDNVYILGDLFPCDGSKSNEVVAAIKRLNGKKILIAGNHDEKFLEVLKEKNIFENIAPHIARIFDGDNEVILCHYPIMSWQNDDIGSIHLYGHIHNKKLPEIELYYSTKKAYNVGFDVRNFVPVNLNEILGGQKCT